ncbi:MAG: lytic murein transglycosylase [Pseudomonadota bacterium]|jgi:membrane-bound lytic murein transglycosylase B
MFFSKRFLILLFITITHFNSSVSAIEITPEMQQFIQKMVDKYHFKPEFLQYSFEQAKFRNDILKIMNRPIEGGHTPWYVYRKMFLTEARIQAGVHFWQANENVLTAISAKYAIPPQIIVAIIGAETFYGRDMGKFRVLDSLITLAFHYPRRSEFFTNELEQFFLLCQQESLSPLIPKGSYTGAMGLGQFMPSSFMNYAIDFDQDQKRNLWNSNDAIASVGYYLNQYGWHSGEEIAYPTIVEEGYSLPEITEGLALDSSVGQLKTLHMTIPEKADLNYAAKLLRFEQPDAEEFWIVLNNFYVITRYNHSSLYAMAVYQLSNEILLRRFAH